MLLSLSRKAMVAIGFLLVFSALASPAPAAFVGQVPEIDPGSAVSGITLLTGGVLVLADKLRAKK